MTTLSNADTTQQDDVFIDVKVVLYVTVNASAYQREYAVITPIPVKDIKEDVRTSVQGQVEAGTIFPDGIIHDVTLG